VGKTETEIELLSERFEIEIEKKGGAVSSSTLSLFSGGLCLSSLAVFRLDSGSRPAALPGMTGCHKPPARGEEFVSEQQSEGSLFSERFFGVPPQNDRLDRSYPTARVQIFTND
jgi:hypothetical protein